MNKKYIDEYFNKKYIDEYFYDTSLTVEWHDDPEKRLVRLTQKRDPILVSVVLGAEDVRSLALTLSLMADIMEGKSE